MSEIEKMYEKANIKAKEYCDRDSDACMTCCPEWENRQDCWKYKSVIPPFTAEKQIAIENIIFQCNFGICELQGTMPAEFTKDNKFVKHYFSWWYHAGDIGYYNEIVEETYGDWDVEYSNPDRGEALAGFVNALWNEYLSDEEKQQIKEILE